MSQTFSGPLLIGVIVLFTLMLFVIGLFLKPKYAKDSQKRSKMMRTKAAKQDGKDKAMFKSKPGAFSSGANKQLLTLKKRISSHFPDFEATVREHHLVLQRHSKKVAMITLDNNVALGRRRLGDVAVINFHKLPSVEELKIELSGV